MRELIANTFATLDGVMQAPVGPEESPSPASSARSASRSYAAATPTTRSMAGAIGGARDGSGATPGAVSTPRRRRQGSRHVKALSRDVAIGPRV